MRGRPARIWFGIALSVVLLGLSGCTREKAEAIKTGAEQLRAEAVEALSQVRALLRRSVAMPTDSQEKSVEKLVEDIAGATPFTSRELNFLLVETNLNAQAVAIVDQEFATLELHFTRFASMFRSLPEGSLLASKSVKKAEVLAIHLTMDLMHFADYLQTRPIQFTDSRVLLLEQIQKAKSIRDETQRKILLTAAAESLLQLRAQEVAAREQAQRQCLKAAEISRAVAEMIRDYNHLTVSDALSLIRQAISFAADITEGNADVAHLLDHYKGVEETIRTDKYWSALLNMTINP